MKHTLNRAADRANRPGQSVRPVSCPADKPALTVCLFAERHDLPINSGALFTGYNWETHEAEPNREIYWAALSTLTTGRELIVYVTGLTPALTEFIAIAAKLRASWHRTGTLRLRHYDRDLKDYFEQTIF